MRQSPFEQCMNGLGQKIEVMMLYWAQMAKLYFGSGLFIPMRRSSVRKEDLQIHPMPYENRFDFDMVQGISKSDNG